LPFETLHEGSAIRFLGSVYATAQTAAAIHRRFPRTLRCRRSSSNFERCHCLPHAGGLLPGGEIIFILYDMTKEVGQGSGSSERMGWYDRFISLLFYAFLIMLVSVIYPCCFKRCYESVSYVQSYRFCLYLVFVSVIRYMSCLLVSLIQSSCFIRCCLYVSVVLSCRFTCCLMFIAVMRYMSCLTVMLHISCFHVFNNHMLHMIIDHMFHIVMDMFDIMISMVNNLLYVIIITLICGIKMT
jgi:hypothetical protein